MWMQTKLSVIPEQSRTRTRITLHKRPRARRATRGRGEGTRRKQTDLRLGNEGQEGITWASLVAQWLRICLPMQGTQVRALVWEDPTCRGATRPVSHNY